MNPRWLQEIDLIALNQWQRTPSGQVLLATVFFCFIFCALFVGLYKSGLIYSCKERSIRATDLTALSGGSVYANGLQLVRLSNAVLLVFITIDLAVIASATSLTDGIAGLLKIDPDTRKGIQTLQDILFGVSSPTGAYPFLIFGESLATASANQLKNNWPNSGLSWNIPLPPSPIFLFNREGNNATPIEPLIPNMALKFRTLDLFLASLGKEPGKRYFLKEKSTGKILTFSEDEVELAKNPRNPNQMWVKSGTFKNRYVGLETNVESEAEKDAIGRLGSTNIGKVVTSLGNLGDLMKAIKLDVTDRDDPPDHTLTVFSTFPTKVLSVTGQPTDLQNLSEVAVQGGGLAAWDLYASPYTSQLVHIDPLQSVQMLSLEEKIVNLIQSGSQNGSIPTISNMFNMTTGGQNAP